MNCKPGDLARIVSLINRDTIVRVLDDRDCFPGEWRCQAMQSLRAYSNGADVGQRAAGTIGFCYDMHLRPIRDPGEDAQDETLSWKPVPSREEVEA